MELWHLMNKGVEERNLFLDSGDYIRFVQNLYQMNDALPALEPSRRHGADSNVGPRRSYIRERLVDIHGWCLMKNHYHLLLSELVEGGLSKFMMKVNVGYAKYVNEKYERSGTLFHGRTKRVLIERHSHYLYILHYLHLNPLDYLKGAKNWRARSKSGIRSSRESLEYLQTYRWSSYLDYTGQKNFPSLITKDLFEGRPGEYVTELHTYLRDAGNQSIALGPLTLE